MLFMGNMALYIAGITAGIVLLVPIICMTIFIMDNAAYLSEAVVDEVTDLIHKIFKRKHKK
jgi:hypothetical protein